VDFHASRRVHGIPTHQGTASALLMIGGEHFVAPPSNDGAELLRHPAIRMTNGKLPVDEFQPLPQTVHQPLIEFLQRRHLSPGPIEHQDNDSENG
jgi:hypothetical protein